ncbi:MAG TPA: fibronectin-binding domain-containing protein [Methanothermococcus okinawensis]|uniref:Archaeal Rqc2 homolog aRqcH n=1 Tax=Methanothermococcus okinawensis TaxID=155863 RepID=A0A833EB89_9EURY|nr:fibronectin-binding domain-containing protein [Methanothermococcus okinawensis]
MKKDLTNVDIYAVVQELQGEVLNGILDKAFLLDSQGGKELILKVHVPEEGAKEIAIGIGTYKYITLTEYEREKPKNPPSFAMLLRKYLKNTRIVNVEQHNFDRIVKITFQWKESIYKLIVELFGEGNVILLDSEDRIILPLKMERWSSREILPKEIYRYPPQRDLTPFNLEHSYEIFKGKFEEDRYRDVECVRIISRIFGLAGVYAEEICHIAGVDKKTVNPSEEEIEKLYRGCIEFFKRMFQDRKPHIVLKDGDYIDVSPVELVKYRDYEKRYYERFINAVDDYFSRYITKKMVEEVESKLQKMIKKQERILKSQMETLKKYEEKALENQIKGDLIYANYNIVEEILKALREARERMDWADIKRVIKENRDNPLLSRICSIRENSGEVVLRLSAEYGDEVVEREIPLDIRKSAFENAEEYYSKSKKFRSKMEGVKKAIEISREKLERLRKEEMEQELMKELERKAPVKKKRKKRKWYEKFKWTVIEGYLVLAGKDATTNEILIKKYTDSKDIVFHTLMEGAPFTVIKMDRDIEELEEEKRERLLMETARFAASHSRAWKLGLGNTDVYWVRPEQISKTAESGEYLKKGAFMVRGKRNFIRGVPLGLGIGILEYEGEKKLTTAPPETVKNFEKYVMLKPAKRKKGELIKELKEIFKDYEVDDEDILRVLPPGESDIVRK